MLQQMLMQPVEAVELTAVGGGATVLDFVKGLVAAATGLGLGRGGGSGGEGGTNVNVNCIGPNACGNITIHL